MRTNAPEEYHHDVDGGAPALLGSLVLISVPFGHSMTKGEKFELVFKWVYIWVFFAKLQLSVFWSVGLGASQEISPYIL